MMEICKEVRSKRIYMSSREEDITRDKKEERKEKKWKEITERRMG
jgi:hypothetical protein